MEELQDLVYWHWWIVAVIFVILEVFAPGAVLIWFGMAASVVGLLLFIFPDMMWELQFAIFGVLSVSAVVLSRRFLKKNPIKTDQPNLNKRGAQYIDRVFTLDEAVENGYGKINVDDTTWKIHADGDIAAGEKVKVTAVDGTVLTVERYEVSSE